jgi:hypothetical protein
MLESWCLKVKEARGFFPVVSMIWQSPIIHVVTPIKGLVTSQVTKTRALTKSLCSPSPTRWSSNHVQGHQDLLRAFITPWQSSKVTSIIKIAYVLSIIKSNKSWHSLEQDPITKNGCTKLLLNLLAFAWFLMSWLDHKCMNEALGALNALGYVWSVLILERAEWEPLGVLI